MRLEEVDGFCLNFKTVADSSFQPGERVEIKWICLVLVLGLFDEDDDTHLDDFEFVCWNSCLDEIRFEEKYLTFMYLS